MGRISLSRARNGSTGSRRRGFTLIQILAVVAISGHLAAFVAPRYFDQAGKSSANSEAQRTSLGHALDPS